MLTRDGRSGLTTRRVAQEAGVNHGLVHYHFGSLEVLTAATARRYHRRVWERRQAILAEPRPFIDRWRAAIDDLRHDLASGDARIAAELRAIGFDQPHVRDEVVAATARWRSTLTDAFASAAAEYGLTASAVAPIVALVTTFTTGLADERMLGIDDGHAELLEWVDGMIVSVAAAPAELKGHAPSAKRRPSPRSSWASRPSRIRSIHTRCSPVSAVNEHPTTVSPGVEPARTAAMITSAWSGTSNSRPDSLR